MEMNSKTMFGNKACRENRGKWPKIDFPLISFSWVNLSPSFSGAYILFLVSGPQLKTHPLAGGGLHCKSLALSSGKSQPTGGMAYLDPTEYCIPRVLV